MGHTATRITGIGGIYHQIITTVYRGIGIGVCNGNTGSIYLRIGFFRGAIAPVK